MTGPLLPRRDALEDREPPQQVLITTSYDDGCEDTEVRDAGTGSSHPSRCKHGALWKHVQTDPCVCEPGEQPVPFCPVHKDLPPQEGTVE